MPVPPYYRGSGCFAGSEADAGATPWRRMRTLSLGVAADPGDNVGMRRSIALLLALAGAAVVVAAGAVLVGTVTPRESSERVSGVAPISVERVADEPTPTPTPTPSDSATPAPVASVKPVAPEAPHDVGDDHGGDRGTSGGGSDGSGGGGRDD
jgi:hypothetical protein